MKAIKLKEGYNSLSIDGSIQIYVINGQVTILTDSGCIQEHSLKYQTFYPLMEGDSEEDKYTFLGGYVKGYGINSVKYDLYYFINSTEETVIAKWGDKDWQYNSGLGSDLEQLIEAKKRAIEIGLLVEK